MEREKLYTAYFDGSYLPNKDKCITGFVIYGPDDSLVEKSSREAGQGNSHIAECKALYRLATSLERLRVAQAIVYGDSQSLIQQVQQLSRLGLNPVVRQIVKQVRVMFSQNPGWNISWVPRKDNFIADALACPWGMLERIPKVKPTPKRSAVGSCESILNASRIRYLGENDYLVYECGTDFLVNLLSPSCSCATFSRGGGQYKCRHLFSLETYLSQRT
jgi:ribonuclease HI